MRIQRIAALDAGNLLISATSDDYDIGMPESLAHWDGICWKWLDTRVSTTMDVVVYQNAWAVLDFSGKVRLFDGRSSIELDSGLIGANELLPFGSELVCVAANGGLASYSESGWKIIRPETAGNLYSINRSSDDIFVCGSSGGIFRYSGSSLEKYECTFDCDFTSVWCVDGDHIYLSGGKGDVTGGLLDLKANLFHEFKGRLGQIRAVSASEIYCVDWRENAWLWNGSQFCKLEIGKDLPVYCLSRYGDIIAYGCQDAIGVLINGTFHIIKFNLDSSHLDVVS